MAERADPLADWEVTVAMWEDLLHLAAFQIIHGPEGGYRRFRYLRFGIPESAPLPPGFDTTKRIPLPIFRRAEDA